MYYTSFFDAYTAAPELLGALCEPPSVQFLRGFVFGLLLLDVLDFLHVLYDLLNCSIVFLEVFIT